MMNKSKRSTPRRKKQKQGRSKAPAVDIVVCDPTQPAVNSACMIGEESRFSLAPYDENLLERSRTQWQFGDWKSLSMLSRDTLQYHPDRAKLALLAAAGLLQTGDTDTARHFVRLAQDWGCGKKLVSQILVAGVHNSLGKAAALIGDNERAMQHFENSIATATACGDVRLLSHARAREELEQLNLPALAESLQGVSTGDNNMRLFALSSTIHNLTKQLQNQTNELTEQVKKQNSSLVSVRNYLESTVKKEILNATQQLEAFLGIQNFLNHGERLPGMHGWPISPDFALFLIELIDSNDYDLIIEFGSGTSTVLIAKTLSRIAHRRKDKTETVQVAFEHLEQYHMQTLAHLQQSGHAEAVQLIRAPLSPYEAPNGNTYFYYSCQDTLVKLAQRFSPADLKILLLVDGPPGSTGKHARYPAVPIMLNRFKEAHIDILLDDYNRDDEKEIALTWLQEIKTLGYRSNMYTKKMEKDACLISIQGLI